MIQIKRSYYCDFENLVGDSYMWEDDEYEVSEDMGDEIIIIFHRDVELDENDNPIEDIEEEYITIPKSWVR